MAKVLRGSSRTKSHRHRLCAAYGRDHFLLHKGKDSCFNGWFNHGNVALRALNKCETKIRNRLFRPIVVESSVEEIQVFGDVFVVRRSEEHTSELQSRQYLVCRLLLEKK